MKHFILICVILCPLLSANARFYERGDWKSRLAITGTAGVWSPRGYDADLFQASLGYGISALYWFQPQNQVIFGVNYTPLQAKQEYWRGLADTSTFDVWDVAGKLLTLQLELRRLFPTDNLNFLYFGIGGELHFFGDINGNWEIYTQSGTNKGTIKENRNPNFAAGLYGAPGMFFIFYKKVFIDVGVRLHWMNDGKRNTVWLQPAFTAGWRIF